MWTSNSTLRPCPKLPAMLIPRGTHSLCAGTVSIQGPCGAASLLAPGRPLCCANFVTGSSITGAARPSLNTCRSAQLSVQQAQEPGWENVVGHLPCAFSITEGTSPTWR